MTTNRDDNCKAPGCDPIALERLRYFNGRFLSARDLRDEQAFHMSRHRLHQRLLHGWGTVCGLDIVKHPRPECAEAWVVVRHGIAIDCCGREVIVPADVAFELPSANEWAENERRQLYVSLCYRETPLERVPVLDPSPSCCGVRKEDSRIRQGYVLCWVWLRPGDAAAYGWKISHEHRPGYPQAGAPTVGDQADAQRGVGEDALCRPCPEPGCLEPNCPPDHCVLLAHVRRRRSGELEIVTRGRRHLPPPGDYLTHIARVNWPHGGELTLAQLRAMGRLEISFDRPVQPPPEGADPYYGPSGVNAATFIVQYGGGREDLDFVPASPFSPRSSDDGYSAIYELEHNHRRSIDLRYLENQTVYITVLCDHIHDCNGHPVDGNFFGTLPSGDGVRGGTFHSWFRVRDGWGGFQRTAP